MDEHTDGLKQISHRRKCHKHKWDEAQMIGQLSLHKMSLQTHQIMSQQQQQVVENNSRALSEALYSL